MGQLQLGDTTLTKVFVGGLAWETQKEVMREHFEKYGEILEAVIISDKLTGRSKGYGFVTFKEAEAAKKACEDATPLINGRRANCNLASLGARRPRSSSTATKQGSNGGAMPASTAPANQVQWYYPTGTPPPSPFHHHHAIPFHAYGYSPAYISTGINHNPIYTGQGMVNANSMMPVYHPLYHFQRTQTMGVPTHIFHSPLAMPPNTGGLAVE